jgi:hypothetical protein
MNTLRVAGWDVDEVSSTITSFSSAAVLSSVEGTIPVHAGAWATSLVSPYSSFFKFGSDTD